MFHGRNDGDALRDEGLPTAPIKERRRGETYHPEMDRSQSLDENRVLGGGPEREVKDMRQPRPLGDLVVREFMHSLDGLAQCAKVELCTTLGRSATCSPLQRDADVKEMHHVLDSQNTNTHGAVVALQQAFMRKTIQRLTDRGATHAEGLRDAGLHQAGARPHLAIDDAAVEVFIDLASVFGGCVVTYHSVILAFLRRCDSCLLPGWQGIRKAVPLESGRGECRGWASLAAGIVSHSPHDQMWFRLRVGDMPGLSCYVLWVDSALETDDTVEAPVDYTVTDKVAVLTMRHGQVNAIDDELIDAIHDSLRRADADPQVGAIILTSGLNGVFCGGMNLKMAASGDVLALRRFVHKLYIGTLDLQYKLAKPTIAAINGPARGAGMTLAITCDMAVAAEETDIAYPEINVGLIAAIHNVHLARQIGRAKAFELLMGGNPITAREAERIGLINHVVPETQVLERALDLGRTMAAKSPTLMALARGAFVRQYDLDYRRGVEQQIEALCTAFSTDDGREGLRAFAEKRKPQWTAPEDTQ